METEESDNPFQSPVAEATASTPAKGDIVGGGAFTERDLRTTFRALTYNYRLLAAILPLLLTYYLTLDLFSGGEVQWLHASLYIVAIFAVVFAFLEGRYYLPGFWRSQRIALRQTPHEERILIDDVGVRVEDKQGETFAPWSLCSRQHSSSDVLVVMLKPTGWIALPAHYFESRDAFLAARQKISAAIRSPKSIEPASTQPGVDAVAGARPDAILASGTLTEGEFLRSRFFQSPGVVVTNLGIFVYAVWSAILYGAFVPADKPLGRLILAAAHVAIAILLPIAWLRRLQKLRRTYRDEISRREYRWAITAEHLAMSCPTSTASFAWRQIERLKFRDELLLFVAPNREAYALSRRFFASEEEWRQIVEWARQSQR